MIARYDDYWGEKAQARQGDLPPDPRQRGAAPGAADGRDPGLRPRRAAGRRRRSRATTNLQILDRPAFNVGYVGFNQAKPPLDKLEVRQAIAHGLNRQEVVDNFYGGRGEVAKQFMPPEVVGLRRRRHRVRVRPGEVEAAPPGGRSDAAGDDRVLVPERRLAAVHAGPEAQLRGVRGQPEARPASRSRRRRRRGARTTSARSTRATRRSTCSAGRATSATRTTSSARSSRRRRRRGASTNQEIFDKLDDGGDGDRPRRPRRQLYEEANRLIMDFLPGVPYVHTKPALAFAANVRATSRAPSRSSPSQPSRSRNSDADPTAGGRRSADVALRRPPAAAPRPDPARALDPRLLLDPGAAGRPGAGAARRAGDARRRWRRSSASTGSTSRSTSSTGSFIKRSARLDFGDSVTTRRPVTEELKQRFPATIELALAAMLFSIFARHPARLRRREALRDGWSTTRA